MQDDIINHRAKSCSSIHHLHQRSDTVCLLCGRSLWSAIQWWCWRCQPGKLYRMCGKAQRDGFPSSFGSIETRVPRLLRLWTKV